MTDKLRLMGLAAMRFSSGPLAHLEPSTNSVLLRLCQSQSAMLPFYNSLCDSIVREPLRGNHP